MKSKPAPTKLIHDSRIQRAILRIRRCEENIVPHHVILPFNFGICVCVFLKVTKVGGAAEGGACLERTFQPIFFSRGTTTPRIASITHAEHNKYQKSSEIPLTSKKGLDSTSIHLLVSSLRASSLGLPHSLFVLLFSSAFFCGTQ